MPLQPLPDWAAWLAQDADGAWWCFEAEPNQHDTGWYENEVGRYLKVGQDAPNPQWREALLRATGHSTNPLCAQSRERHHGQDPDLLR